MQVEIVRGVVVDGEPREIGAVVDVDERTGLTLVQSGKATAVGGQTPGPLVSTGSTQAPAGEGNQDIPTGSRNVRPTGSGDRVETAGNTPTPGPSPAAGEGSRHVERAAMTPERPAGEVRYGEPREGLIVDAEGGHKATPVQPRYDASAAPSKRELTDVRGIGVEELGKLESLGIHDLAGLAAAEPMGLVAGLGVTLQVARRMVKDAGDWASGRE